jgi:DNA-binding transcriptional LysR family regulator
VSGRDAQLVGNLRVTLSPAAALGFMAGELVEFSRLYPSINLDIVVSDQQCSLSRREADVAIRTTESPSPDLVGRRLFKFASAVYASAEYLRAHRENKNADDITWIGWGSDYPTAKWIKETGFPSAPVKHRVRDIMVQIELVKAGMGISLLPCIHGDSDPNLRRWPTADPILGETIWLLTHADLRNTARVRLFMVFAANAIERYRDRLQGTAPAVGSQKS